MSNPTKETLQIDLGRIHKYYNRELKHIEQLEHLLERSRNEKQITKLKKDLEL